MSRATTDPVIRTVVVVLIFSSPPLITQVRGDDVLHRLGVENTRSEAGGLPPFRQRSETNESVQPLLERAGWRNRFSHERPAYQTTTHNGGAAVRRNVTFNWSSRVTPGDEPAYGTRSRINISRMDINHAPL